MKNFLKKLVKPIITICIMAVLLTLATQVASAAGTIDLLPGENLGSGLDETQSGYAKQIKYYEDLPTFEDEKTIFRSAIKTMLYLAGFLATLGLIVVGYMFMVGAANEESLTKARKLLGYLGIGILIMAASYAIISGILQIKLF
jgi:hypothetical protein